jgi:hypothetical protein
MNGYEKIGLIIIIAFFNSVFPESWKGGEIIILYLGGALFILGKHIEEAVIAFRTV